MCYAISLMLIVCDESTSIPHQANLESVCKTVESGICSGWKWNVLSSSSAVTFLSLFHMHIRQPV